MKRGEVWAIEVREADDAFSLVVIVQEDAFDATDTATICPLTAYRDGGLNLEQLMAFALTDDYVRQEQGFRNLSYN